MINLKSPQQIEILRQGGQILAEILEELAQLSKPGVATLELDRQAQDMIRRNKALPSFLGYNGYPAALCTSVNDQVVHGLPSDYLLEEGDLLSLDLGIEYKGLFTDMAITIPVGKILAEQEHLNKITKDALDLAVSIIKPGIKWGDVAYEIQKLAEGNGLGVVRDLVGHGVGFAVHEEPTLPNFGQTGTGIILTEGMVLAVEPMFTLGDWRVKTLPDGWTVETVDKSFSAHFEHTIAVTEKGALVLTR